MGDDYFILREDGFLSIDVKVSSIVYHNILNLILIKTVSGVVHVLDVNSGVLLLSSDLSSDQLLGLEYIPGADRILYWDEKGIGARSDYNGVLLLHSALQQPLTDSHEQKSILLELLLSEAVILNQCLPTLDSNSIEGLNDVALALREAIDSANQEAKKGVKAQKWSFVVLNVDQTSLRQVANGAVTELKSQSRRIPALAIASSIAHRANDLVPGSKPKESRILMSSEAARKDTFKGWPHMDYKWALPAQMAQAGFYHQPSTKGEDRAMCFTCMVCLVCWEKSDEPWVEHERHSPNCPFVRGEYTHNVPTSVANATTAALPMPGITVISKGNTGDLIAVGKSDGQLNIFKFDSGLKPYRTVTLSAYDAIFSGKLTTETNKVWSESLEKESYKYGIELTSMAFIGLKPQHNYSQESYGHNNESKDKEELKSKAKPSLICGVIVSRSELSNGEADIKVVEDSIQSTLFHSMPDSSASEMMVKSMNDLNHGNTNSVAGNSLFLLTYAVEPSSMTPATVLQSATNSSSNKSGGSTKVISRPHDTNVYDDIYGNNYSDDDTELPNYTTMDDNWGVIQAASSSKEGGGSSKFYFPKKIMVTKHIKVFPSIQHPIKVSTNMNKSASVDEHNHAAWMQYDSAMQDIVDKLTKDTIFTSLPPIIKMTDQTDAAMLNGDPFTGHLLNSNVGEPMEISTLKFYGDSNEKFKLAGFNLSKQSTQLTNVSSESANLETVAEETISQCVGVQCVCLPNNIILSDKLKITALVPSENGKHLVVVISTNIEDLKNNKKEICDTPMSCVEKSECFGYVLVYNILSNCPFYTLDETPSACIELPFSEMPLDLCMLPSQKNGIQSFASISVDGSLKIYTLPNLKQVNYLKIDGGGFVSVAYCTSVERICVCSDTGLLYFYSFSNSDQSSNVENNEDEGELKKSAPNVTKSMDTSEKDERLLEKSLLEHGDLKTLMELTGLYGGNVGLQYNAVVPGFWCELSPAQRPRDDHQNHRRWRLQTNVSTWDEHMLEITLPMATPLAHIQFSYNLHQPCVSLPIIQVTLLKQNLHGIGMKRQTARQGQEDSNVTFPLLDSTKNSVENPVNSKEYLRAHNAEILAGPVLLSQGLDLSQQRGSLILTSPKLYRAKGRTFLIHIKTLFDPAKDNTNYKINKSPEPNGKKAEFIGCDWLHHISITVRGLPRYEAPERRLNRIGMLESNNFLDNLFSVANNTHDNYEKRMRALDIILWVVSVRLQRFRTARPDKLDFMEDEGAPTKSTVSLSGAELQQHECVSIVERNVNELIVNCVLNAKRSIAKKSIMIILITNEGVKNLSKPWKFSFEATVLNSVVNCIPLLGAAPSAGGMHWLSKLAIQVSPIDAQGLLNEKCLNLLEDVAVVMEKRINMYYCLLRARFGLYGLPLEEEIFEQEAPTLDKSAPPVMPYGTANSSNDTPSHPSTTRVQNDLRDLYYMISEQDAKNRTAWWKEWDSLQFDESLPLIVTCHSASDGTKLESAIPTSNMDHPTQLWVKVNEGKLGSDWQKMGGWDVWEDPEENLMECEGESGDDVSQDAVMQDPLLKLNGACWSMSWGWVLQGGGSHTLLVERMHSGARRFAVLQLPRPVRLTDIIIPACNELVSLSVEVWLTDEEKDCTKIIHHTTIVNTPLLLTDIQPAPICRFIKITTIGRYGMPAMKCRIPLGNFFGEVVDLPTTRVAIESLLSLKEDVTCRYRLAANKLKELLDPFLDNYEGNFGHMTSYLASPGEADPKVLYAYEETIDLQRQLYRIKCVLSKVQGEPSKIVYKPDDVEDHRELLEKSCTDKLRAIVDNVLHMLLYFNYELEEKQTNRGSMTEEQCERVLGLLACSSSNTAASLALLLVKLCGSTSYWPRILPKSLLDMAVSPVPKPIDRYLILVILMARRTLIASSSVESGVTEAIATSVFSATGPARLLILTLLASCLDAAPLPRPSWKRWDFVTGGRAVSQNKDDIANGAFAKGVNPDIRIHRRKLHKKLLHYKHNLPQDIDSARRAALHVQRLSLINKIRTGSESNVERPPQLLTQDTAAALVRHLLQLVNDADQDSLILIAKVVGRVVSSRGGGSISSEALKPLCKRAVSTSSWPAHALTTLLQDFVEYEYCAPGEQEMSQTARYSQEDDPSLLRPRPLKMIVASRSPAPCISPVTCDMPFVDYEESDFEDRAIDNNYVECMGKALAAKQPTAQNMPPSNNLLACIPSVWCYGIEWRAGIWSERARCEGSGSLRTALSSPLVRARLPSPPRARRQRHLDVHRQLHEAFSELFSDMQLQHDSTYMENVLSLWMTLNATAKPETHIQWVPVTENMEAPRIRLTVISVRHLLQSLVQQENISLRCWIMALHTLAWICQSPTQTTTGNTSGTEETMAEATLQSPNFVLALIKFMSTQFTNDGIVLSSHLTSEWGAMLGPTACAALSYVLRRVCGGHANGAAACARALGASLRVKSAVDVRVAAARHLLHSVTNLTPAHRNDVLMLIDVTALAIAEWMCSSESSNVETSTLSVSENPFSEPTLGGLLADVLVGSDRTARKTVDRKQLMATTLHCCRSMLSLPLECDSEEEVCETDESKASQKADTDDDKRTKKPKIADAVLQNRGTMYRLLKALTYSDASNYILTKRPDVEAQLTMDTLSISDELYLFMTTLAELASNPELIVTPLLNFMSDYKTSNPREKSLSNGFVRLVEVSISECGALGPWCANGGLAASVERAVSSLESPATLAAALLDHLKLPPRLLPLPPKRSPPSPADLVHQDLINYAPLCSVMCSNPTAQAGDVLVGCNSTSGTGSVRRARAAAWTYHFYGGDEPALTLALAPPHAFKLHEIHLQPHLTGLATCPSAVGVEISCGCNNVPLGAPQPTSGLTFIRLALSKPTVVTALQIKLYKPRDSSNMGLLNIRVLGTPAFAFSPRVDKPLLSEEWMRVVSRCVGYMSESGVSSCEEELRSAAAACVEALIDRSPSARAALTRLATARPDMVSHIFALLLSPKPHDYDGAEEDEKCSLTYWLCTNGSEAEVCLRILMSWVLNSNCASPQQFQCLASSLWWHREHNRNSSQLIEYDECLAIWQKTLDIPSEDVIQKKTLDAVLCSMCYIKPEFYKRLLQEVETKLMGDHVENESVTDDRKAMTILPLCDWSAVTNEQLNTMAMCAQSPSAVTILLSSRLLPAAVQTLTQFGNQIIPEITNETEGDIQMGEYSKFGSNIVQYVNVEDAHRVVSWLCCASECDCVSEWLGRSGHAFWKPLLLALSLSEPHHRNWDEDKIYRELEEKTIRLFSTMTTMNSYNQKLFATTLHDILKAYSQYNPDSVSGVSGFTRALIVRLLLRCERARVALSVPGPIATHPKIYSKTVLRVHTRMTIAELLNKRNCLKHSACCTSVRKDTATSEGSSSANKAPSNAEWEMSVAAASCAKDKRTKDVSNARIKRKRSPHRQQSSSDSEKETFAYVDGIDGALPLEVTIGDLCAVVRPEYGANLIVDFLDKECTDASAKFADITCSAESRIETPVLLRALGPELVLLPAARAPPHTTPPPPPLRSHTSDAEWVKLDELFHDVSTTSAQPSSEECVVPAHSLFALGLLLKLPGYAEAFLQEGTKAVNLLRLLLAVTDDEDGRTINGAGLGTLPLKVLARLLQEAPPHEEKGRALRKSLLREALVPLLFTCLAVFTHHAPDSVTPNEISQASNSSSQSKNDEKKQYWAKGTGFGTGSTQQSWNVEQALLRQKTEEEHVTVLLQVISSYIYPNEEWNPESPSQPVLQVEPPNEFINMLCSSALVTAICSYLRNDSVLDMSRHIGLYVVVVRAARALWALRATPKVARSLRPIPALIAQMARTTSAYANTLRANKKLVESAKNSTPQPNVPTNKKQTNSGNSEVSVSVESTDEDEGLAALILDIQATAKLMRTEEEKGEWNIERPLEIVSREARYIEIMRKLQFDSFEMIEECSENGGFRMTVSHAFEAAARAAGTRASPQRMKRLAQEAATLASSLPLSHSSSVFVRTDTARLDIMKVLITGPSDTPYANGCFVLDVYFPPDYPNVPMMVNLETTGRHTVRFNPNLYNDGKVCLSVLNTWHGRPEEKWNAHTSSFLQVLVSIQSLILVPEPYFNEPGYERSRGTRAGAHASVEYNSNIYQACVRWAMLELLREPTPCFKEVIQTHFWIKRNDICKTVAGWIEELDNHTSDKRTQRSIAVNLASLKRHYVKLCEELGKLQAPPGLEDLDEEFNPVPASGAPNLMVLSPPTTSIQPTDTDMEKIVSEVID